MRTQTDANPSDIPARTDIQTNRLLLFPFHVRHHHQRKAFHQQAHQPSAITKDRDEERSTLRHRKAVSVANNGIWTSRSTTMAKEGRSEEEETDSKDPLPQQSSLDTTVRILWNLEFTSLQLALFVHPSTSSCIITFVFRVLSSVSTLWGILYEFLMKNEEL
jgi:outer membrane receptor for ferrienterochelin and colicin